MRKEATDKERFVVATSNSIINKTMDMEDLKSDEARSITKELNVLIEDLSKRRLKVSSWYGLLDVPEEIQTLERQLRDRDRNLQELKRKQQRLVRQRRRVRSHNLRLEERLESMQTSRAWRLVQVLRSIKTRALSIRRTSRSGST
jgi:hypothetical protein